MTDGRHGGATPAGPTRDVGATPLDPLALRSTIERQSGAFHVEEAAASHGMRYVIELPLRAVDAGAPPLLMSHVATPGDGKPALLGMKVMTIDDQADARETLQLLLELEGAGVLTFAGGGEALQWLQDHGTGEWPHVIVCDIGLGDEDGHAVVSRIRQLEAERGLPLEHRVPAVALTGRAQPDDRIRALMAGFQVHLAKPVNPQELISTLVMLGEGARSAPALPPPGSLLA